MSDESLTYSYWIINDNIEIIFLDFLINDFLDLRGLWLGRQCAENST